MHIVSPPQKTADHPGRARLCEHALDPAMRQLVDAAIIAGWTPDEVFEALEALARRQMSEYARDPDPADDP